MRITITGAPGSGTSTVARILSDRLNLKHYSAGDIRREIAAKKGITLEQLNKEDEKNHEADKIADDFQKKLAKEEDDFVFDGRLSAHFIPNSIKILLKVDPEIGAQRVFGKNREVEKYSSTEEAMKKLEERETSDRKRYKEMYGIEDYYDESRFDLVLDTTNTTTQQTIDKILQFLR